MQGPAPGRLDRDEEQRSPGQRTALSASIVPLLSEIKDETTSVTTRRRRKSPARRHRSARLVPARRAGEAYAYLGSDEVNVASFIQTFGAGSGD